MGTDINSYQKYRIYVDETGNSDLESSDNPNHRFLSLTGVIIDLKHVETVIFPELEALKQKFFHSHPDEPIILHRKEMVNKKHPFEVLNNKDIEEKFNELFLKKLREWNYTVITVLIDKNEHKEQYNTWRYDPYHYCLAVLLERFIFFLINNKAKGDIMIESRGGKEDLRLKNSFRNLFLNGTDFIKAERFNELLTSKELKVKAKSNNISGLQLADLIAHSSRRDILLQLNLIEKKAQTFGDRIIEAITPKYHQRAGKIMGYGMKKLP